MASSEDSGKFYKGKRIFDLKNLKKVDTTWPELKKKKKG